MPDVAVGDAAMVTAERKRIVRRIADARLVEAGIDAIGKEEVVDVSVARLPEFGRCRMHDGEDVILAQRVGKKRRAGGNVCTHGVSPIAGCTDISIDHVDKGAVSQVVEKGTRVSPAGLSTVEINVVEYRPLDQRAVATRQVCRIEPA